MENRPFPTPSITVGSPEKKQQKRTAGILEIALPLVVPRWQGRPTMSTSTSLAKHTSIPPADRWIIAIGVMHLLKSVLFLLLGIGAVRLLHKDLVDVVTHFIESLRFDTDGPLVSLLLDKVALIDPHRLKEISVGIFAYAIIDAIEGTGLVMRKTWAEYVTLILTASFLPWEFFEILRHVTWIKIVITIINILVVLYLAYHVQRRARQHNKKISPA
jgi:uncharacterized membrane protein (DUF2068 family)